MTAASEISEPFPRDPRALPEEMESAFAERQRGYEVDGRRRTDREEGAPATEVFPGFRVRLVGDAGTNQTQDHSRAWSRIRTGAVSLSSDSVNS